MKALVIYESMYGNTRRVAEAVADGLRPTFTVEVVGVAHATAAVPKDVDLLVVGGPTHVHGVTRPSTRKAAAEAAAKPDSDLTLESEVEGQGLREWFSFLAVGRGVAAAAFDTRLSGPSLMTGRASLGIAKHLRHLGYSSATAPTSFLVDKHNRLLPGELERAKDWGSRLATQAATRNDSVTLSQEDNADTSPRHVG